MNRATSIPVLASMMLLVLSVVVTVADDFSIDWNTIDGGGDMWSVGGDFELGGSIGQPDAGVMSGGTFAVTGGFWFGIVPGDSDHDGDVDLDDFADFEACLLGPDGGLGSGCGCFDFDASGDVSLKDFAAFEVAFTGP